MVLTTSQGPRHDSCNAFLKAGYFKPEIRSLALTRRAKESDRNRRRERDFISGMRNSFSLLEASQTLATLHSDKGWIREKTLRWESGVDAGRRDSWISSFWLMDVGTDHLEGQSGRCYSDESDRKTCIRCVKRQLESWQEFQHFLKDIRGPWNLVSRWPDAGPSRRTLTVIQQKKEYSSP